MKKRFKSGLWVAAFVALLWFSGVAYPEASNGIENPFDGRTQLISKGKTLFNIHCSHCHGPNAVQGERKRDLRRLSQRYQDRMPAVYYQTVTTGRAAKGMPAWKGILNDETLWTIFTFLETVQKGS